ncbi:MAG: hypothetical protein JWO94_3384 [Verrucomicrobiaceae bacterium]|nr:hypothetical protein [Verrucomicrobiaceae bacterium]
MPAASPSQRQANLDRLLGAFVPHCPPDAALLGGASAWAERLPLTHATHLKGLEAALASNALLSQQASGRRPGKAETLLETADDVFFYAGAFTYPGTECGFLFLSSLEGAYPPEQSVATPFDSGALAYIVAPPPSWTDGTAFVRDHELPVPAHRTLLGRFIAGNSPSPEHFIRDPMPQCRCGAMLPHPLGLPLDDRRRSTFEVRLATRVPLDPLYLRAVFVRKGYEPRALHTLLAAGVHIESFTADDDGKIFEAMRESCITFLLDYMMP